MMEVVAGIDIGGTNTVYGLVTREGDIVARGNLKTTDYPEPQALVDEVSARIKDLLSGNNLVGAGIGAPNGNHFHGTIEFAPNLNWFGIIPLASWFEKALDAPVLLTNDANAAALGEKMFGGARNMRDFLFVTLGTGLGSGFVANNELIYGHDSFAGELGHVIVEKDGRQCGCGRRGCLETYASATGIKRTYSDLLMSKHRHAEFEDKVADARFIFNRAVEGDPLALEAFRFTGEVLGLALANAVAITSPEAIFLFGGLAQAGHFIFEPTINSFESHVLNIYKGKTRILPSELPESDAALLGAAGLMWQKQVR
ncbi:MAG TPA: ROK family protein [Luteibaculaceae bacterium]|nr:ROK family protein [Luteibaculaceae bacterium]